MGFTSAVGIERLGLGSLEGLAGEARARAVSNVEYGTDGTSATRQNRASVSRGLRCGTVITKCYAAFTYHNRKKELLGRIGSNFTSEP